MNIAPVAYRYANSLLLLATEHGTLEGTSADMRLVSKVCAAEPELRLLLKSPVVKPDKKDRILDLVFAGRIGEVTAKFIGILVRKGREALLPDVAAAFTELYRKQQGLITCEVRSAIPLSAAARKHIQELAESKFPGKTITLSEKVDAALIGGIIVRIGDEQLDASVSRQLHDLRREFSKNPYIPAI
ncbi:MAG: ATP synthase F1 subunit delta [Flavobacteriales bacterium]